MQTKTKPTILALDVGHVRVGVAKAHSDFRIAQPLTTLPHDDGFWAALEALIAETETGLLVVGLPRNLSGNDTQQTVKVREFAAELEKRTHLPVELQDEALTSQKAEEELSARGKPYQKGDIDALAATYILEDYLEGARGVS